MKGRKAYKKDPRVARYIQAIGQKIKRIREKMGYSQEQWAQELGISQAQVSKFEKGEDFPTIPLLRQLKEKYGVDLNVLLDPNPDVLEISSHPIPFYRVGFSAGNGEIINDEEILPEPIAVSEAFVRNLFRTSPGGLVLFPVVGNSMEPTIPDGSIAVVKKMEFENTFFEGAVYALIYDNELFVKRLRKRKTPDGIEWKLISDNPEYEPIVFVADETTDIRFEIIGRVVGFLKSLA